MSFRVFIGHDSRWPDVSQVAAHSLRRRSSISLDIGFLDLRHLAECYGFRPEPDPKASTEFTRSRFLVPWLCGYEGVALFVDNDVLFLDDASRLQALPMTRFALRVVKHDQKIDTLTKMHGASQEPYPRKNWSSVMLMDTRKLRCWTKEVVETAEPKRLHRFEDVPDEEIGDLDPSWNCLDARLLHYTSGGPWFEQTKDCPGADLWLREREAWQGAGKPRIEIRL